MPRRKSNLEEAIFYLLKAYKMPLPDREYRFHPTRKWRFDFCWPDLKLAAEADGAIWVSGRHSRGSGIIGDCEKYNAATVLGWRILRYNTENYHEIISDLSCFLNPAP